LATATSHSSRTRTPSPPSSLPGRRTTFSPSAKYVCHPHARTHTLAHTHNNNNNNNNNPTCAFQDRTVKEWDGDNFEKIANIGEHHDMVSGAAISEKGNLLVTCSHDHSIRLWERTREMLNPEEEAEFERERAYEEAQAEADARVDRAQKGDSEATAAGKKSTETLKAAEQLMEAIDIADADALRGPGDAANPLITAFRAKNGSDYLRLVMDKVCEACPPTLCAFLFTSFTLPPGQICRA
jgi:hypothetical protein